MSSRRRSKSKGSPLAARIMLIAIFLLYRALDALVWLSLPPESRLYGMGYPALIGFWTTVLLVAMWYRQAWARYLLAAYLLYELISSAFYALAYIKAQIPLPLVMIIPFVVNLVTLLAILFVPQIRSLTRFHYPNSLQKH